MQNAALSLATVMARWVGCIKVRNQKHLFNMQDSWEAGYFRDCNGKSNGQPLPGTVIRLEAAEAAKGEDRVTAQVLGISQV